MEGEYPEVLESSWDISFLGGLGEGDRDDDGGVVVGVCGGKNSRSVLTDRNINSPARSLEVRRDSVPNSRQAFSKQHLFPKIFSMKPLPVLQRTVCGYVPNLITLVTFFLGMRILGSGSLS